MARNSFATSGLRSEKEFLGYSELRQLIFEANMIFAISPNQPPADQMATIDAVGCSCSSGNPCPGLRSRGRASLKVTPSY